MSFKRFKDGLKFIFVGVAAIVQHLCNCRV